MRRDTWEEQFLDALASLLGGAEFTAEGMVFQGYLVRVSGGESGDDVVAAVTPYAVSPRTGIARATHFESRLGLHPRYFAQDVALWIQAHPIPSPG